MLKLVVAYDGRRFAGSQRQAGKRTVQAELERACEQFFGVPTACRLAGRTDSGVHAVGQVAAIWDVGGKRAEATVERALNALLPEDIAVTRVSTTDRGFDPRRDARWREYRYRIAVGGRRPLLRGLVLEHRPELALDEVIVAAGRFIGEHDFAAFAGMGAGTPWSDWRTRPRGTTRRIFRCECRPVAEHFSGGDGDVVEVVVVGDAFLPRQVRTMVGALLEVGRRRREPAWIDELLARADRRNGPETVPAHGLVLWAVGYAPYGDVPPTEEAKKEADGPTHIHPEDRGHQA